MLNRAALFATMFAGAGLTAAVLLGQNMGLSTAQAASVPEASAPVEVLAHAPVGWHLTHEGDRAKLAYGVENSDQILVMLSCAPGEDAVEVFGLAAPEADSVRLVSASLSTAVTVETSIDPMSGSPMIETTLPLETRALHGFRDTGRLSLGAEGEAETPAHAVQAELADVRAFFDHCERRNV